MKKIYSLGRFILLTVLAVWIPASCSKDAGTVAEIDSHPQTFIINAAIHEDENPKTILSGKDVLWTDHDTVGCLCYDDTPVRYAYTGGVAPKTVDGRNATFEVTTISGLTPKILICPDNTSAALDSIGRVLLPLPSEYYVKPGEVPALVSAGLIEDGKTTMRNILSFMKFTIESEDIASFRISAAGDAALSGTLAFDPLLFSIEVKGSKSINIYPADTSGVFSPGVYYAPVPAGTYPDGLSVKFFKKDGMAAKKTLTESYTISRNRFINMGTESQWDLKFLPASTKVNIVFSDGVAFKWNFSADSAAVTPMTMPNKTKDVIGKGRVGPYYPIGYPGAAVYFCVQNTSGSKSYFDSGANYGIRYGGTSGDYMTLPAVESYRMSKVVVVLGSKTSWYAIATDPAEGSGQVPQTLSTFTGKAKTFTFSYSGEQTLPSTSYRLSTTTTYETAIWSVEITYEIED